MKDAYYFPHDTNAVQDPKMMKLLFACGACGIGMYWIIIEVLHQQPDGKITYEEYKAYIQFYMKFESQGQNQIDKIEQMLITCSLLLNEDGYVYSPRVLANKRLRSELSITRSMAGKISAQKRALKTNNLSTHAEQVLEKIEQRKGKESKGNIINSKKTASGEKPVHVKFMDSFCLNYQKATGSPYLTKKEDFINASRLIDKYTVDVVRLKAKLLHNLCRDKSSWFTKDGYSSFNIGTLTSKWNEIIESNEEQELELT